MEQLTEIIKRLHDAKVEYSLIGGLASRHHGVTLVTEDVDVCARFSIENLRRLELALKGTHPRHRMTPLKLTLELNDELCLNLKNLYLLTDLGVLDVLSEVAGIGNFEAVMKLSQPVDFPFGRCHLLTIDGLIQAKQAIGRPHDLITITQLKAIRERKTPEKD